MFKIGAIVVSLLRLRSDPAVTMTAASRVSFGLLKDAAVGFHAELSRSGA